MFCGLLRVVVGEYPLHYLLQINGGLKGPLWWQHQVMWTILALACALAATAIGAILASRRSRTPSRWPAGIAAGSLVATVFVGLRYDEGPLRYGMTLTMIPSMLLRTGLALVGGMSLLVLLATLALRRGRRENAALDDE
jgi:hypothetical protein